MTHRIDTPASQDPEDLGLDQPIRDAATLVLVRTDRGKPQVLMGQRGAGAAFMPSKFVFPGGAIDGCDAAVPIFRPIDPCERARLLAYPVTEAPPPPEAMIAACVRELWEEAGLCLAAPRDWDRAAPSGWENFARASLVPDPAAFRFIFRAVTPPGRTRRFDARFFLADAKAVCGDPDDFSRATAELQHLHWIAIDEARGLDLPFVTEVVLAEVAAILAGEPQDSVPFFDNAGPVSTFRRIA